MSCEVELIVRTQGSSVDSTARAMEDFVAEYPCDSIDTYELDPVQA